MRTEAEVLARFREHETGRDRMFGWRREVLVMAMSFEDAKPYLIAGITETEFKRCHTDAAVRAASARYLPFAFGKALNHRGISASRSVEKLSEWLWLLGDREHQEIEDAPYPNYGCPKLRVAARILGVDEPDDPAFDRMAQGAGCEPGCVEGCGV